MWPDGVVLLEPMMDHYPGLSQRGEQPVVQTSDANDRVEAFIVCVLPRTARIDVVGIDLLGL